MLHEEHPREVVVKHSGLKFVTNYKRIEKK